VILLLDLLLSLEPVLHELKCIDTERHKAHNGRDEAYYFHVEELSISRWFTIRSVSADC
jgi:hypothetical protein